MALTREIVTPALVAVLCIVMSPGWAEAQDVTASADTAAAKARVRDTADTLDDNPSATIAWTDTLILVTRPISRYGSPELEDPWLLRLCGAFLRFRFEGIPAVRVVGDDEIAAALPSYADTLPATTKPEHVEAARALGARYVVLLQARHSPFVRDGELALGRETFVFGELYDAARDSSVVLQTDEVRLKHLGATLDSFVGRMVEAMGIPENRRNRLFLASPILGPSGRRIRKLRKILETPGGFSDEELVWRTEAKLNALLGKAQTMTLGYYVAAEMFAEGGRYEAAARFAHSVANRLKGLFPPAYLEVARNYRRAGECAKALEVLDEAEKHERIAEEVTEERRGCR